MPAWISQTIGRYRTALTFRSRGIGVSSRPEGRGLHAANLMCRHGEPATALVPCCRPEPDDQFGRYAAAVLDFDALRLSPFTNLGGVQPTGRCPAPTARGPASSATAPPRGLDVSRQRLAKRLGVLRVQVDLVLGTIQRKADRTLCLATIDVIDEQGLYLLSHVYSVPLVE